MNDLLNNAIDALGRLQFETGGRLLEDIAALRRELIAEKQRRVEVLRKAGVPDEHLGISAGR
jgi:hypothetical protein